MDNNTSYETQAIDINLLSVLDITKEGKVVSAEKWVELWNLVFQHINKIDAFCVDMQSTLDNWHEAEIALNEIIEDMQIKYNALSTGFTHYGEAPPQNPHIKFWIRRMNDVSTYGFLTNEDVDSELSSTSENPVQNKVANAALNNKMNKNNPTGTGSFSLNRRANTTVGSNSHAEGWNTEASGSVSHAEGNSTTASGNGSHAEGYNSKASGNNSHAEGNNTKASGGGSHAEGWNTNASGNNSHAEGSSTTASGYVSHAEGDSTKASGSNSHAEGYFTQALGDNSHTEGMYTVASSDYQHVQGKYNIADTTTYADIIGNGSSDTERSNAYTLDWNGNAWYAGDVYVGSTSGTNKDEGSKKLATEEVVLEVVSTEQARANNTFANVLKGSKSDSVILIDDVSPITHDMSVKVSPIPPKNLLNRLIAKAYSSDVEVPTEDFINTYCSKKISFKQGTTYTFSIKSVSEFSGTVAWQPTFYIFDNGSLFISNATSPPVSFSTDFFTSDSNPNEYVCYKNKALWTKNNMIQNSGPWSMTITPVKDFEAVFIVTNGNVTDSTIVTEAQIEVGSTATSYVPYTENPITDLTTVKVRKHGKNLLPLADSGIYYNGSISSGKPFIYNSSLGISNFNDIDVSSYRGVYAVIKLIEGKTYTLTIKNLVNNCATKQITLAVGFRSSESTVFGTSEKNNSKYSDYNPSSFTFTVPSGYPYCLVGFYNYPTVSGDTVSFDAMQLELGTTATEYEPYITPTEYTPTADGVVNGVTSLYPNTTFMTDTDGVLIDCEYNRDINKAFAELQQAIISLGGNV